MTRPCDAPVTTPFGNVAGYVGIDGTNFHNGVDYGCNYGTPLRACISGKVTYVGTQSGYGVFVEFQGSNGRFYLYAHCDRITVANGQNFNEGDIIAYSGNSGYSSGPHVHVIEAGGKVANRLVNYMNFDANQFNQGGTMESMSDDTGRQVQYHYLGENGFDGRPNALTAPSRLTGTALTNASFGSIFLSEQSRNWRDIELPRVYGERNALREQVAVKDAQITALNAQVSTLVTQLEEQATTINQKQSEIDTLIDDNEDLNALVKEQADDIKELEAQLATCGASDVTINFNIFGNIFWALIKAFGTNKVKGEK